MDRYIETMNVVQHTLSEHNTIEKDGTGLVEKKKGRIGKNQD
jgi:hypothetical protein